MTVAPMNVRLKPRRRARKLLIALGLMLSAAWLVFFVLWLQTPGAVVLVPPPLPKPNGYDVVLNASKKMEKLTPVVKNSLPNADTLDTPALREFVEKNKENLAQVRVGLEMPFQIPFTYDMDALVEQHNTSAILRTRAARVLYAEGVLARRDRRFADAMRSSTDMIRLGRLMERNVPMNLYMQALVPSYLGIIGLRDTRADFDVAQLRSLIEALKTFEKDREPIEKVIERENVVADLNVRKMGIIASTAVTLNGMLATGKQQNRALLEKYDRLIQLRYRLLIADLAVRLYHKENGKYPAELSEIKFELPPDPYSPTHGPFIYRLIEGGYQLYSVGPDGDDDKLEPVLGNAFQDMSNGDWSLDSL